MGCVVYGSLATSRRTSSSVGMTESGRGGSIGGLTRGRASACGRRGTNVMPPGDADEIMLVWEMVRHEVKNGLVGQVGIDDAGIFHNGAEGSAFRERLTEGRKIERIPEVNVDGG